MQVNWIVPDLSISSCNHSNHHWIYINHHYHYVYRIASSISNHRSGRRSIRLKSHPSLNWHIIAWRSEKTPLWVTCEFMLHIRRSGKRYSPSVRPWKKIGTGYPYRLYCFGIHQRINICRLYIQVLYSAKICGK